MNYKKIDSQDISYLKTAVSPDRVFTGEEISEDYGHDELGGVFSMPEVLIKVMDTGEVAAVMSYASEKTIPVVVRGAGTGLVGGAVAVHGGIMLDTTAMNHILELDRENLTVTVEPGVLLMDRSLIHI